MIRLFCIFGLLTLLSACSSTSPSTPVDAQVLLRASNAWDGSPYTRYATGQPELSLLKIRIAADTTLDWHRHPAPNAGYLLKGDLTVETREGRQIHLRAGDTLAEVVDRVHRGRSGSQGAELIVFYAGTPGQALSEVERDNETPPAASPTALSRLLDSIDQRLDIAEAVALHKWDGGLPVEAPEREQQVIASAKEKAREHGLDAQRTSNFFSDQIEASKLLQYGALSAWHAEGRAPDDERLDLHSRLRPQLDQLQQQLIERLVAFDQEPPPGCEQLLAQSLGKRDSDPQRALALIRASARLCEAS